MALYALLTSLAVTGADPIACTFAGPTYDDPVVAMDLEPVPSLKDRPGLYRVMMRIGTAKVRANARPLDDTPGQDVIIRAKAGAETFYTVGLRADGGAALNVYKAGANRTLVGQCRNHEPWFPTWLGAEAAE